MNTASNPLSPTCLFSKSASIFGGIVLVVGLGSNATAATFSVNRSWNNLGNPTQTASLVGTVEIPLGSYSVDIGDPDPFTSVDLLLTVNGNSFNLTDASTGTITPDTVDFLIEATETALIFDVSNVTAGDRGFLAFIGMNTPVYSIGRDFAIASEATFGADGFGSGPDVSASINLPVIFGTNVDAIPEPLTIFGATGADGFGAMFKRRRNV